MVGCGGEHEWRDVLMSTSGRIWHKMAGYGDEREMAGYGD